MDPSGFDRLDAVIAAATAEERPALIAALSARIAALAGAALAHVPPPSLAQENLSVAEGAKRLGLSARYVYRHANELPVVRIGRRLLLSARGIDRFISQRAGRRP
jgi:excisionase family DNA binding protein